MTYAQKAYTYDHAGNITAFEGGSFPYDVAYNHGVLNVNGVQKYWYDAGEPPAMM